MNQVLSQPQIDRSIFDGHNYSLPKSGLIMTRLSENLAKFGTTYSQFTIAIVILGGLTNITFLISIGISIALWFAIMKNEEVLDYIPNFGHLSNDKKKVVLFLLNILLLYIFCGDQIFTYIGIGFLISFIHAYLFISPSTVTNGDLIPEQANQDLTQYVNFSNTQNVELQIK